MPEKRLEIRTRQFRVLHRLGFLKKKNDNLHEKYQFWSPASVIILCDFIKTGLHHGYFPRNVPTFFGVFVCLVSQIIIVLIGLKGNCVSAIGEIM